MKQRELERLLAYVEQDIPLRASASKPRRIVMRLAIAVGLLALLLAAACVVPAHFLSEDSAVARQATRGSTADLRMDYIQHLRDSIDGSAECEKFACLFTQFLRAFEAGLLAS